MLGVFLTVSMIMLDLKIKAKFTAFLTRSFNTGASTFIYKQYTLSNP